MSITLPYYPLSNTGVNDATKINADLLALSNAALSSIVNNSGTLKTDNLIMQKMLIVSSVTVPTGYYTLVGPIEVQAGVTITVESGAEMIGV
jgi:hypothetical protein